MTTTSATTTGTLRVPDARLHYEVRGRGPLVALVGAPMGAAAFEPLADLSSRPTPGASAAARSTTPSRTRPRRCAPTTWDAS
jgi:hypothetical protein